jgi:hypothetical protein
MFVTRYTILESVAVFVFMFFMTVETQDLAFYNFLKEKISDAYLLTQLVIVGEFV